VEELAIEYFYKLAEVNKQSVSRRGKQLDSLSDIVPRMEKYFEDYAKMKQNLLKFADSQNPPGKFVYINLW
jgi:hypothetical protein